MSSIKHRKNKRRIKAPVLINNYKMENDDLGSITKQYDKSMHGGSKSLIKQGLDPEELNIIDKNFPLIKPKLRTEVPPKKLLPGSNVKRRMNFIKSRTIK